MYVLNVATDDGGFADTFDVASVASKVTQLEYAVTVTNTGSVAGDAVVLAFVSGTPADFPLSVRVF